MEKNENNSDYEASIRTVLPAYSAANSTPPRRADSPTPSYRTVDPNTAAPMERAVRNPLRRLFWRPSRRLPVPPGPGSSSLPPPQAPPSSSEVASEQSTEKPVDALRTLSEAVRLRQTDQIRSLLQEHPPCSTEVNLALELAAENNFTDILQILLDYTRDTGVIYPNFRRLFYSAMLFNAYESIRWLSQNCPQLDERDHYCGSTVLHEAVRCFGRNNLVIVLLKSGGSTLVECRTHMGNTALHEACRFRGRECLITTLLDFGADINAAGWRGDTPLHWAVRYGVGAAVKTLLNQGADMTRKNDRGHTPLVSALLLLDKEVESRPYDMYLHEVLLVLMNATPKDQINTPGPSGETLLHLAVVLGELEFVDKLLSMGANVEARTRFGQTPLHYTVWGHRMVHAVPIAERLIQGGASTESRDMNQETPLESAKRFTKYLTRDRLFSDEQECLELNRALQHVLGECLENSIGPET